MTKYILTGTHHSGKSSIIENFKEDKRFNIIGELIRSLSLEPNFKFTPDDKEKYAFSELSLLHFYYGMAKSLEVLSTKKYWLFDRCIIDVLYYINYFNVKLGITYFNKKTSLYAYAVNLVTEIICSGWFEDAQLLLMAPIPIKSHDGFRLEGENVQKKIYEIAKNTLEVLGLPYKECNYQEALVIINEANNKE